MMEEARVEIDRTELPKLISQNRDPKEVLLGILERMGFQAEVKCEENDERIMLEINGANAGLLIGNKGEMLDALQYVLSKILRREEEENKSIILDCGGYRQRRAEALEQLAYQLGDKAAKTGKIVAVNPMSAHDRRIIHMALKDSVEVTTRSEGEGLFRRILIVPTEE